MLFHLRQNNAVSADEFGRSEEATRFRFAQEGLADFVAKKGN